MSKEYNELKKNTIIIAIANLGSKFIAFFLAPMYSYYLNTSQYGTMDLINSTITLIAPFIVLDIYDATFRYASDNKYDSKKVLSTSIAVCIPSLFVCIFLFSFGNVVQFLPDYFGIVSLSLLLTAINSVLSQFLRGTGKMVRFGMAGIVSSIFMLVANYFLLVQFRLGLWGWLYSLLICKIAETVYLLWASKTLSIFSIQFISKEYFWEFMHYCLPLLPTASMWWIMNLSDRYMLAIFVGTASTGLYAVANKLPSMLSIFENIFYQAWQTTAINTLDNKDRDSVYSSVLNNYFSIMLIGLMGILIIGKPMIVFLFEESYFDAYKYIPLLVIAVVIHALSGNIGSLYSVFKNTKGCLYSSIVGALINIILNIVFIPVFGILGACLTTIIGYLATLLYRLVDIRKYVDIKLDVKKNTVLIVMVVCCLCLYFVDGYLSYGVRILATILMIFQYRTPVLKALKR